MMYLEVQKNKKLIPILVFAIILALSSATAYAGSKVTIVTDPPYGVKITNAEKQKVVYGENVFDIFRPSGDMKVYKNDYKEDNHTEDSGLWELVVDDSEEFVFAQENGKSFEQIYIRTNGGDQYEKSVSAIWAEKVILQKKGITVLGEKGSTCDYSMGLFSETNNILYNVTGLVNGNVTLHQKGQKMVLEGAQGRTNVMLCSDKDGDKIIGKANIFCYGDKIIILRKGNLIIANNANTIPSKITKKITLLYLRPSNNGKNMFLSWNKVKRAKSYLVYRYDLVKRKYIREAVRNGSSANYCNIPKIDQGAEYRYKVVAKSKAEGKGKKVCKTSYPVWGVAAGNSKGNAKQVNTNKRTLKGKIGKKTMLKASVKTEDGKQILSKDIRWYSNNSKIAKVDKHSGKVILKKKGRCLIWAKAHNGRNSRPIKVVVKGIAGS